MALTHPTPGQLQPIVEAHFARILEAAQTVGFSARVLKTRGGGVSLRANANLRARAMAQVLRLELYASAGLRHLPDGSAVTAVNAGLYLVRGGQGAPATHLLPPWDSQTQLVPDAACLWFEDLLQQHYAPALVARALDEALSA